MLNIKNKYLKITKFAKFKNFKKIQKILSLQLHIQKLPIFVYINTFHNYLYNATILLSYKYVALKLFIILDISYIPYIPYITRYARARMRIYDVF
jgi:hypothetical protein